MYPKDEMPEALAHHTSTIHNGHLYILGGTSTSFEKSKSTPFFRLHLKTNLWERLESPDEHNLSDQT